MNKKSKDALIVLLQDLIYEMYTYGHFVSKDRQELYMKQLERLNSLLFEKEINE